MRRFAALALVAASLAACDSSGGVIEPNPDIAEDYIGNWTLNVPAVPNCWAAFQLNFAITIAHVDAFRGQTSFNFSDPIGWFAGSAADRYPLTATVNGANQSFLLRFGAGSPVRYGNFIGGDVNKNTLTGTFSDDEGLFRTTPGTRPCDVQAQAARAG